MKTLSLWILGALFIGAGCLHLIRPQTFMAIMPPQIPRPEWMVAISGVAEILGGLGLLIPATRPIARWGLVALLVAVFPANIYMALRHIEPAGMHIPAALLWARLPVQPLLIWWVLATSAN